MKIFVVLFSVRSLNLKNRFRRFVNSCIQNRCQFVDSQALNSFLFMTSSPGQMSYFSVQALNVIPISTYIYCVSEDRRIVKCCCLEASFVHTAD